MSSPMQPRGPLPARIYWIRRLLLVAVVVVLVVGVAQLLGGGSDGAADPGDGTDRAATVSSEASESPTESTEPDDEASPDEDAKSGQQGTASKARLPRPDGPCEDSDVVVKPVVEKTPEAGRDVRIRLRLRTQEAEACTWQVSRDSVTVSITSGDDEIWTSRECPRVIPTEDVVVRSETSTTVPFTWNARRSDDECTAYTDWAMEGWYHVESAAFAGEPTDVQFELTRPVSETITKTITPKPRPKPDDPEESEPADESGGTDQPSDESTEHRAGDDGGGNSEG